MDFDFAPARMAMVGNRRHQTLVILLSRIEICVHQGTPIRIAPGLRCLRIFPPPPLQPLLLHRPRNALVTAFRIDSRFKVIGDGDDQVHGPAHRSAQCPPRASGQHFSAVCNFLLETHPRGVVRSKDICRPSLVEKSEPNADGVKPTAPVCVRAWRWNIRRLACLPCPSPRTTASPARRYASIDISANTSQTYPASAPPDPSAGSPETHDAPLPPPLSPPAVLSSIHLPDDRKPAPLPSAPRAVSPASSCA